MTAAQYDAERKRTLGVEATPGSSDTPTAIVGEQTRTYRDIDSSGTDQLDPPGNSTRPVHPEG